MIWMFMFYTMFECEKGMIDSCHLVIMCNVIDM